MKFRLPIFFCLFSLALIVGWQQHFHLPWVVSIYHLLVATVCHLIVITSIALVAKASKNKWLAGFLLGNYFFVVVLFYALLFGSMAFWGDIITLKIIATYLHDFSAFLQSLPIPKYQAVLVFVAFYLVCVLPFVLAREKVYKALLDGLSAGWQFFRFPTKLGIALGILLLLLLPFSFKIKRTLHLQGEPLLVLLFDRMWGVQDNPLFNPHRIAVRVSDLKLRKEYAKQQSAFIPKNVVLIVVDALRANHLSTYGYARNTSPFLKKLQDEKKTVQVKTALSTCACTTCGVPSILLSRDWKDCTVQGFNVIGLLKDKGFDVFAFVSGAHKEWYNLAKFYSDDCNLYFDGKDSKKYYFKDDRVLQEGLESIQDYAGKPSFFYFHLQSTHETGLLQEKYALYRPYKKNVGEKDEQHQIAINEYDNKVVQADATIQQLFEELEKKKYLQNSMVIITSDHGQGLGEHGIVGHVDWLYQPQISIPFIIYDDSVSLYHNLSFARQIDIAPTIVDRLGLPIPASWIGNSLLKNTIAPYSYHETGKNGMESTNFLYSIVSYSDSAIYKYIFNEDFSQEEIYDIAHDSLELKNLIATPNEEIAILRKKARKEFAEKFEKR
jgi:glucan phosphoethanolaminetransferase (alkaline phosphatase superfamily)